MDNIDKGTLKDFVEWIIEYISLLDEHCEESDHFHHDLMGMLSKYIIPTYDKIKNKENIELLPCVGDIYDKLMEYCESEDSMIDTG